MRILKLALVAVLPLILATNAGANEYEPQLRELATSKIQSWLTDPAVVEAIKAQNQKHDGFDETKIVTLEKNWRAETNASNRPMINDIL